MLCNFASGQAYKVQVSAVYLCSCKLPCKIGSTEDIDHAFQVISHGRHPHFCLHSFGSAQQQARMAEDVIFKRCKGMLDRRTSQFHQLRRATLMHAVERILIEQPRDPTKRGLCALRLLIADFAVALLCCIDNEFVFLQNLCAP